MSNGIDRESIRNAYEEVRQDGSDTNWCVLKYDGNKVILHAKGSEFSEFRSNFADDERAFGFLRVTTGDELSRRSKFALIAWIGQNVSAIKKARMSTDKAFVKEVIRNFAVELQFNELEELDEDSIKTEVMKAGGANYGTGSRD